MQSKEVFTISLIFILFLASFSVQAQETLNTGHIVDRDNRITESYSDSRNPNYIQFSLTVDKKITWWKAIKVYDNNHRLICTLSTQDDNKGPVYSARIPVSKLTNQFKITFWKAKAFGVHTKVGQSYYRTADFRGDNIHFKWHND